MKGKFNVGDVIRPGGYNEEHAIVSINDEGYTLDNGLEIPFKIEDAFVLTIK